MKSFLTSTKGRIISGVSTVGVVGVIIAAILIMNSGYRTIAVDGLNGQTVIDNKGALSDAYIGQHLKKDDDVTVQTSSDLTLSLDSDKYVYGEENTHFWIEAKGKEGDTRTVIHLADGSVLSRIDNKLNEAESFEVETPNSTMSVRGTVFRVKTYLDASGDRYTVIEVYEGSVFITLKTENGIITGDDALLTSGQSAIVRSNKDQNFSVFVKDDEGKAVREIEYNKLPKGSAYFLGNAIDSGRVLSIGKELLYDVVEITEHKYSKRIDVSESTCKEHGKYYYVCDICGQPGEIVELPLLEHQYKEYYFPGKDCTVAGYKLSSCVICREQTEKEEYYGNHKVDIEKVIKESNCTEKGIMGHYCSVCEQLIEETEIPESGHIFGQKTVVKKPTCKEKGLQRETCKICKTTVEEEIPESGHSYGKVNTIAATNCQTREKYETVCTLCGDKQTRLGDYGPHISGSSHKVGGNSCSEPSYEVVNCTVCGVEISSKLISSAGSHKWGAFKETKKANCSEAGEKTKTCSVCGAKETITTAKGEHTYGSWITDKEATCVEDGSKSRTCTKCNKKETDAIKATGQHTYGNWTIDKEATCLEDGLRSRTCTKCNKKDTEEIPATGQHTYGAWTITKVATCGEKGLRTRTCSKCNTPDTEEIPTTGQHTYSQWSVDVPATCVATGTEKRTCSVCNDLQTNVIPINPDAHNIGYDHDNFDIPEDGAAAYSWDCVEKCSLCNKDINSVRRDGGVDPADGKLHCGCGMTITPPAS